METKFDQQSLSSIITQNKRLKIIEFLPEFWCQTVKISEKRLSGDQ